MYVLRLLPEAGLAHVNGIRKEGPGASGGLARGGHDGSDFYCGGNGLDQWYGDLPAFSQAAHAPAGPKGSAAEREW